MDLFYDSLCELVEDTRRDEPMSRHVTFRTGGPADYFAAPASVRELRAVVTLCREAEKPYFILGNGSNLVTVVGSFSASTLLNIHEYVQ